MKKGWLIAAAIVGCTMGGSLGACSSSNNGTGNSTTSSSSTGTGGTVTTSSSTTGSTTTTTTGAGGASCSKDVSTTECQCPSTLHAPQTPEAGLPDFYCPFSGDGGAGAYCPSGMECCETSADSGVPSQCMAVDSGSCPASSTIWECDDPSECGSGMQCCATPYSGQAQVNLLQDTPVNGQTCSGHYAQYMAGTVCSAACATGQVIMCTSDAECPSGKTCTPFRKAGNQVGGCQ